MKIFRPDHKRISGRWWKYKLVAVCTVLGGGSDRRGKGCTVVKEKLFFEISEGVASRLTAVFDFVWPTVAAMWRLRGQVGEYLAANSEASSTELVEEFMAGSGIHWANLRRSCWDTSWETQKEEFSRILLIQVCALYESWCSGVMRELEIADPDDKLSKGLQFPTQTVKGRRRGVQPTLQKLNVGTSAVMTGALYAALTANKKHSRAHLEELLICYRYFKEARNAILHGGQVSSQLIEAEQEYSKLTITELGVNEVPEWHALAVDKPVTLSLRGGVGFGEVVLRLICTLDAELSTCRAAEDVFVRRWRKKLKTTTVPFNSGNREGRIKESVRKIGFPKPLVDSQFEAWLRAKLLIA